MRNIKPLLNVNVLEIGNSIAEQLVGRHLQMLGAKVFTVSPPKSNISYILTKDKIIVNNISEVTSKIDVIIVRKKLLYEDPSIIYLHMPNFSSSDNEYVNVDDYEENIMALSGLYIDSGIDRKLMGIPVSYTQLPLASTYGSVYGALAVVASLNKGGGDVIEVPLASALMDTLIYNSIDYDCPELYNSKKKRTSETNLDYYKVQKLKDPFYCHYICSDGRPFYLVSLGHINHQLRALKVLGIEKDVEQLQIPIIDSYSKPGWGLGAGQVGDKWIKPLKTLMKRAFLTKPAFEWELLLGDIGVPSSSHRTTKEWVDSEHANDSGLIIRENNLIYPGPISWVQSDESSKSSKSTKHKHVPNTLNILDMSNVIAGPTIASMLSRFGANVTKIDLPNPIYSPDITIIYGAIANVNKKSILLDVIKGKEIIEKLIKESDMIIINSTDSGLNKLGLSPNDLKKINPNIILVQFDAWGGPNIGRRSNHLGYDDNVQAGVGIMERYGGGFGRVEEHAHVGTIDVIAGVAGALSAMSAIYYKNNNTHNGYLVARSSLAALGQLIQLPFICNTPNDNIRTGPLCKGENDLLSLYETLDNKWVLLIGKTLKELISLDDRFKKQTFKALFKQENAKFWKDTLQIQILRSIKELKEKYTIIGDTYQFITYPNHPIGKPITTFAPCSIKSNCITKKIQTAAPKYGEHTLQILKQLDANIDIKELIANNIIATKWSDIYLPF